MLNSTLWAMQHGMQLTGKEQLSAFLRRHAYSLIHLTSRLAKALDISDRPKAVDITDLLAKGTQEG